MEDWNPSASAGLIQPAPVFTGSASLESLAGARIFRIGERTTLGVSVGLYMRAPQAKTNSARLGNRQASPRRAHFFGAEDRA